MTRLRPGVPRWTTHPAFALAVLLAVAVLLVVHGEPQPSSRPSGRSVIATGSPSAPNGLPPTLIVRAGALELRRAGAIRPIALPSGAHATSVLTSGGLSVVLAIVGGRQKAFGITSTLAVLDFGLADAVLPSVAPAAVLVETSVDDPGAVPVVTPTPSGSAGATTASTGPGGPPPLGDYAVRRYNRAGVPVGESTLLPAGMRAGVDTFVGLVVWQPLSRVYDGPVALEPLSARAELVRADGTIRPLGPLYPLAATEEVLLVWDVIRRQFGIMPLSTVITATTPSAASTAITGTAEATGATRSAEESTSLTAAPPATGPSAATSSAGRRSPSATPTGVPRTVWLDATRGFTVTGPARFSPDGTTFAVYAQVGSRRRLVVAQLAGPRGRQVEVLALSPPSPPGPTVSPAGSAPRTPTGAGPGGSTEQSATAGATQSLPLVGADGYPIPAPSEPVWSAGQVLAVGTEGTVVSYAPASDRATLLDLGPAKVTSLAAAP